MDVHMWSSIGLTVYRTSYKPQIQGTAYIQLELTAFSLLNVGTVADAV